MPIWLGLFPQCMLSENINRSEDVISCFKLIDSVLILERRVLKGVRRSVRNTISELVEKLWQNCTYITISRLRVKVLLPELYVCKMINSSEKAESDTIKQFEQWSNRTRLHAHNDSVAFLIAALSLSDIKSRGKIVRNHNRRSYEMSFRCRNYI